MIRFAQQPMAYRAGYFTKVATRRDLSRLIVEKGDLWRGVEKRRLLNLVRPCKEML
jgi:hypothetical protein